MFVEYDVWLPERGCEFYYFFVPLSSEPPYSVFISPFIILWFAMLWCVCPCMLRVAASGIVLSVYISYIYVRFGGWLAWCLVLAFGVCLS